MAPSLTLSFVFFLACFCVADGIPEEKVQYVEEKLFNHLFTGYEKHIFVRDPKERNEKKSAIELVFGLWLLRLLGLEDHNEVLTVLVWPCYFWTDIRLQWDSSEFNGTSELFIPSSLIWKPDMTVLNHDNEHIYMPDNNILLQSNGKITWCTRTTVHTSCPMNLKNFPYDSQSCMINFETWMHPIRVLDIKNNFFIKNQQNNDQEWDMLSVNASVKHQDIKFDGRNTPKFENVRITIKLKRRSSFYHLIYTIPAISCAFLMTTMFSVSILNQGRVHIGILLLLVIGLQVTMLHSHLPDSHRTVPILLRFYSAVGVLTTVATFLSVFIQSNVTSKNRPRLPLILRPFVRFGGPLCCRKKAYLKRFDDEGGSKFTYSELLNNDHLALATSTDDVGAKAMTTENLRSEDGSPEVETLKNIKKIIQSIDSHLSHLRNKDSMDFDWLAVGNFFDRLFLILFLFIILILSFIVLA